VAPGSCLGRCLPAPTKGGLQGGGPRAVGGGGGGEGAREQLGLSPSGVLGRHRGGGGRVGGGSTRNGGSRGGELTGNQGHVHYLRRMGLELWWV